MPRCSVRDYYTSDSTDDHLQNIVAFGFLHGVDAWVQTGYVSSFGTMAGIYVAIMALAIPLVLFGERIRHTTALWRVIL